MGDGDEYKYCSSALRLSLHGLRFIAPSPQGLYVRIPVMIPIKGRGFSKHGSTLGVTWLHDQHWNRIMHLHSIYVYFTYMQIQTSMFT